jgi:hypothetical protein
VSQTSLFFKKKLTRTLVYDKSDTEKKKKKVFLFFFHTKKETVFFFGLHGSRENR